MATAGEGNGQSDGQVSEQGNGQDNGQGMVMPVPCTPTTPADGAS